MKSIIKNTCCILTSHEKYKSVWLAVADICISLLDISFLVGLVFLVKLYTGHVNETSFKSYTFRILHTQPVVTIFLFFILFALKNAAAFVASSVQYHFVYSVASRISKERIAQYLGGSYENYVQTDSAIINRAVSQQPIEFAHYVLSGLQQIFSQSILIIITITAVFILNPLLFPLLVLILLPPVFIVMFVMKRKLNATGVNGKQASEKNTQHLQEALLGFVESNLYSKNDFFIDRYHRFQVKLNGYLADRLIIQNMPSRMMEIFAVLGLLLLVIINTSVGQGQSVQLVSLGALMIAAYKIIPGIVKIANTIAQVKTYAFAATQPLPTSHSPLSQKQSIPTITSIECRNVHFNYPGKKVLTSVSTCMQKGDFVIVSGSSGKGKTSLIHLLLGFLTPASGSIDINKLATDTAARQSYWPVISYIKQQPFFLHASVLTNITFQDENRDEVKLKKILAETGVDHLCNGLTDGPNTMVTENGRNFSGGQRQRIVLARALYKDADVLVLDEPFNELDETAEREMLVLLQQVAAAGKIVILVTHNPAAISYGNKQIMMDE